MDAFDQKIVGMQAEIVEIKTELKEGFAAMLQDIKAGAQNNV